MEGLLCSLSSSKDFFLFKHFSNLLTLSMFYLLLFLSLLFKTTPYRRTRGALEVFCCLLANISSDHQLGSYEARVVCHLPF